MLLSWGAVAAVSSNEQIFRRGSEALQRGDYTAAEDAFQTVLKSEANNLGALGNLGVVYSRTGRTAKAIDVYHRAFKLAPEQPGLLLNLGLAYFKQEQYMSALPQFQQVERLNPNNMQAREMAASCQVFSGDAKGAIPALETLRAVDSNKNGVLYLLGVAYTKAARPDKAKEAFGELLADGVSPAQGAYLMGRINYDAGRFPDAEAAFLDVLKADSQFPGARLALAKVYLSERKNEQAAEQLRKLLAISPNDADANYFLGALLIEQNRFTEAMAPLTLAHTGLPDSWGAAYYLGKANWKLSHNDEAIRLLEQAAERNSSEPAVYYLLGQAFRAAGRSKEASAAMAKAGSLRVNALNKEKQELSKIPGTGEMR